MNFFLGKDWGFVLQVQSANVQNPPRPHESGPFWVLEENSVHPVPTGGATPLQAVAPDSRSHWQQLEGAIGSFGGRATIVPCACYDLSFGPALEANRTKLGLVSLKLSGRVVCSRVGVQKG